MISIELHEQFPELKQIQLQYAGTMLQPFAAGITTRYDEDCSDGCCDDRYVVDQAGIVWWYGGYGNYSLANSMLTLPKKQVIREAFLNRDGFWLPDWYSDQVITNQLDDVLRASSSVEQTQQIVFASLLEERGAKYWEELDNLACFQITGEWKQDQKIWVHLFKQWMHAPQTLPKNIEENFSSYFNRHSLIPEKVQVVVFNPALFDGIA